MNALNQILPPSLTTLALLAGLAVTAAPAAAAPLTTQVYVASGAGFHATSTLIAGDKEAVLVDAQFTRSDAHRLAAMVLESGKTLTTIFITHAHPDHFFGLEVLQQQFPAAKIIAKPEVVQAIQVLGPQKLAQWKPLYGNNLTDAFVTPTAYAQDTLTLEGRTLRLLPLEAGESEVATAVFIPESRTLIAGDVAFDHIHLWLAEGRADAWVKSLATLDRELKPSRVIAGHRSPKQADNAPTQDLLKHNVDYIRAFQKALKSGADADQIVKTMRRLYPEHQLPIIAEIAAKSLTAIK